VIFPGFIHIVKNTTGGDGLFGYTASPLPLSDFNIQTSNHTGEHDFDNITNFTTYTVNESSLPLHWAFDSLNCDVGSPNGGSQTVTNRSVAINLMEGEEVTCTYANHHTVNTPGVSTVVVPAGPIKIGDSAHDTASLTGATSDAGGTISYALYSKNDCTGLVANLTPDVNTFSNGNVPDSKAHQFNSAGTFYFVSTYSGDNNNTGPVSSGCASEPLTGSLSNTSLTTDAGGTHRIGEGGTVDLSDTATLSGATSDATGTITFHLYIGADCSPENEVTGSPVTNTTVSGNDDYDSPAITVDQPGVHHW